MLKNIKAKTGPKDDKNNANNKAEEQNLLKSYNLEMLLKWGQQQISFWSRPIKKQKMQTKKVKKK